MSEMSEYVPHRLGDSDEDVRRNVRTHTRQEWIFEKIRQELSPVTCKLDEKQINLHRTTHE